jgi:hypothetical protein
MALEIRCPGCERTLRVGDEHAGRQVRCPACQQISVAPSPPTSSASTRGASAASEQPGWHMRTPEGQLFGPTDWSELSRWATEGRLAADCQLADSASGPWRSAADWFPALKPVSAAPASKPGPPFHPWAGEHIASPTPAAGATGPVNPMGREYVAPHRGGLILVLGILGFAINCPVFCLMAWVMGSSDLREMQAGRMDRSGEGLTQVGQVLGMILSLLWILAGVVIVLFILFAAISGA